MSNIDFIPLQPENITEVKTEIADLPLETSAVQVDLPVPLLPRSAWANNVAYMRAMFRAKKALDMIEAETENS